MTARAEPVQQRHLRLVQAIEERFEVTAWRGGDMDLWPLARMDLFLDMFRQAGGDTAPRPRPLPLRAAAALARPLTNLWDARDDLVHHELRPRSAHAILLGDGVSLDRVDGAWQDRHGEAVMAALERQGRSTFLMQPGKLNQLPWRRPTWPANLVASHAAMTAALVHPRLSLPDHDEVLGFLQGDGVAAPSLTPAHLARRVASTAGAASTFQRVLRKVRPQLAFVVGWYAGLGPAFALACRREGVLCTDLQHCPQEGARRGYSFSRSPAHGYSTMPGAFWTWSEAEARHIADWAPGPWHRSLHGGHLQLAPFLDDDSSTSREWDVRFAAVGTPAAWDREVLVALQPIGRRRAVWSALARRIVASPPTWRWWIRRHPASSPAQDGEYADLLALRRANVVITPATELPLPALLRHMSAVISLASGAAVEAAAFGVPALFLDDEALGTFSRLIEGGHAELIGIEQLLGRIAALGPRRLRPPPPIAPPVADSLERLQSMAEAYRRLCREQALR